MVAVNLCGYHHVAERHIFDATGHTDEQYDFRLKVGNGPFGLLCRVGVACTHFNNPYLPESITSLEQAALVDVAFGMLVLGYLC